MKTAGQITATGTLATGEGLFTVFRDLTGTFLGGVLAWGLTCTVAGAIPVLISDRGITDFWLVLGLSWIGHLIVAGIGIWGIAFVVIHTWCLHLLVCTDASRLRVLAGAFLSQLTVSAMATALFDEDNAGYLLGAWGVAVVMLLPFVMRPLVGGKPKTAEVRIATGYPPASSTMWIKPVRWEGVRAKAGGSSSKRAYDRAKVTALLRAKVRNHFRE